jgi:hypothetical protein
MTLASEAIQRAYRESNLVMAGASPSTTQAAEGLVLLNAILPATLGFAAGEELRDLNIGGEHDESDLAEYQVPENARLVLNLGAARTLQLHQHPYEGQRIAVADAGANLATYNLTLDGNGRRIETAATVVLNTSSLSRQWFYRGDTANWQRLDGLVAGDTLPFPTEFDDYFIILLAMRLNPRHGREMAQASAAWLGTMTTQLEARYRRPRPVQGWGSLGLLGQRRDRFGGRYENPLL